MNDLPQEKAPDPVKIDIRKEVSRLGWKEDPVVGFDQQASLTIAKWVLLIFAAVYSLGFVAMFFLFYRTDATFEKGSELVKFMVQSILPLVTLAIGYYLGDRSRHQPGPKRGR